MVSVIMGAGFEQESDRASSFNAAFHDHLARRPRTGYEKERAGRVSSDLYSSHPATWMSLAMALPPFRDRIRLPRALVAALDLLKRGALDFFFPMVCRTCGSPRTEGCALCEQCRATIEWVGSDCHHCGMPVANPSSDRGCSSCRGRALAFDRVFTAGLHSGPLRQLVLLFKYHSDAPAGIFLEDALADVFERRVVPYLAARESTVSTRLPTSPPTLVPIPSHWMKVLVRGRDPTRELCVQLSRRLKVPFKRILRRARWVDAQTRLSRTLRLKNQRRAFRVLCRPPVPETVILLDDVVTTCATVDEAARVLKAGGVRTVIVLAVARSRG